MQLNNKNGKIIRYVNSNNTGIAYDIWENGLYLFSKRDSIKSTIDRNFIPVTPYSINDLEEYLTYEVLEKELKDYTLSTDVRNWAIEVGSTGLPTTVRVYIPNELDKLARKNRDIPESPYYPLYQVIKYVEYTLPSNTAILTDHGSMQYLEDLEDEHRAILNLYTDKGSNEGLVINDI
jgi:hypothetical protein